MSVSLRGNIVQTPKAAQPLELSVKEVDVLGECDAEVRCYFRIIFVLPQQN